MFFDEGTHPAGVTFDDGESSRRNMPWSHFHCAEWDYADPTAIRVEMGDWQVVISGHNLEPLFGAIEAARLARASLPGIQRRPGTRGRRFRDLHPVYPSDVHVAEAGTGGATPTPNLKAAFRRDRTQ